MSKRAREHARWQCELGSVGLNSPSPSKTHLPLTQETPPLRTQGAHRGGPCNAQHTTIPPPSHKSCNKPNSRRVPPTQNQNQTPTAKITPEKNTNAGQHNSMPFFNGIAAVHWARSTVSRRRGQDIEQGARPESFRIGPGGARSPVALLPLSPQVRQNT